MIEYGNPVGRMASGEPYKIIHTMEKSTWTKYGKYRTELRYVDGSKGVCWLSDKQQSQLEAYLNLTPKGYSTGKIMVVGIFGDNGYYRYTKLVRDDPKYGFREPAQLDLRYLRDD